LYYRIHDARIEHRQQDAELSLGMFCNVFRHVLGPDWSPLEVCFEHGNGSKTGEHERMFGAPVRFGRRTNAIAFKRADLDAPMPEQDPYLFSIVESFLRSRCQLHEDPTDFAAVVHEQIKLHMRETAPVIADIAAILGISDRAFQRRLKRHRLTYHDLLRAVRRELALKYMRDPDIPLTDIAMMVGYPELSAFSRAFRAWTGMSPQRYRRTSMRV
jgi:AraC-like DNA-binding protein